MLLKIEDCLNKICLIGLSYFDHEGHMLKENRLAGIAIKADKEKGISFRLINDMVNDSEPSNQAEFVLPADFSCWFVAPKGRFHTHQKKTTLSNPDFLVTWDIYQARNDKKDGNHQWWEWIPRTTPPEVGY